MEYSERYSGNLSTERLATVIEEYSHQHPEYSVNRNFQSSGHVEGHGGSSDEVIELRSREDNEVLLRLTDLSTYETDSGDYFDNSSGGRLNMFCGVDEAVLPLYDALVRLAKLCLAIKSVEWQQYLALADGTQTKALLDSIEPQLLETMRIYMSLGEFDVEACVRILKWYKAEIPLSEHEIAEALDAYHVSAERRVMLRTIAPRILSWLNSASGIAQET